MVPKGDSYWPQVVGTKIKVISHLELVVMNIRVTLSKPPVDDSDISTHEFLGLQRGPTSRIAKRNSVVFGSGLICVKLIKRMQQVEIPFWC